MVVVGTHTTVRFISGSYAESAFFSCPLFLCNVLTRIGPNGVFAASLFKRFLYIINRMCATRHLFDMVGVGSSSLLAPTKFNDLRWLS